MSSFNLNVHFTYILLLIPFKICCLKPWANQETLLWKHLSDSRCFLKCFPVCPPVETLVWKQNLLPEKQKCFLANSETFDVSQCFSLMFPSVCPLWETWRNIGKKCFRNNVSQVVFTLPALAQPWPAWAYILTV